MWMDEADISSIPEGALQVDKSLSFVGMFTLAVTIVVGFFPNVFGLLGVAASQLLLP